LAAFNVQDAQLTVKAQQNYPAYKRRAEALAPYVKEVLKEKQATAKANEEIPPSAPNQEIMTLAKERYDAVFGNDPAMQFTDIDDLTATRVARAKELNLKLGLLTGEMQGQLTLDEQKRVNQARVEMMKGLAQQQQANPPIPPQALAGQGAGNLCLPADDGLNSRKKKTNYRNNNHLMWRKSSGRNRRRFGKRIERKRRGSGKMGIGSSIT
jgi:hypothetical protein